MEKLMIIIAGMPASGKTTFANYLSATLHIPLVCKDRLKEILWDRIHYDGTLREESQKYGGAAYDLSFHFCEELMKCGVPLIFESNLGANCPPTLEKLVEQYGYKVITVLFDGDVNVIHQRFVQRDRTEERHPGLVSGMRFDSADEFAKQTAACRGFSYWDHVIRVDTTDFEKVSYDEIVREIQCNSILGNIKIMEYEEKYRDDMVFMVLEAKNALERIPRLNEDFLDIKQNYIDKGDMFWLALDENDRVVGCIGYNSIEGTAEAKLHRLYVKANLKRRGIGTRLLHTVENHLRAQGKTAVHVHVGGKEYYESHSFYPKHGYVEEAPSYLKKVL